MADPVRVCISGAGGQIGYSLIPLVAGGYVFGEEQPVSLHLYDIPQAEQRLVGVAMEIRDSGYGLVRDVVIATDADTAFKDVNFAFLVGGFPRGPGMERKDLLAKNAPIFIGQGQALNAHAAPGVKVVVVANPANTNCLVLATNAPDIPKANFSALTRLDHNRATTQVAEKAGVTFNDVKNVAIFGNHSKSMVPSVEAATVTVDGATKPARDVVDEKWLAGEFVSTVQQRGAAVINARGLSSAMSAAKAAADHMRTWVQGTPEGEHTSMAIWSDDNPYGVADGVFFSFPVTVEDGEVTIVEDVGVDEELLRATEAELLAEKKDAGL